MLTNCLLFAAIIHTIVSKSTKSDVDNDLAADEECPRIRRAWNELSDDDRNLYISGVLKLRENSHLNRNIDEYIAVADIHQDHYSPFTHMTSNFLFWHGYILWELESRIRALGGEYKCFGMPYWDFTVEAGREDDPFIFSTGLGGDGDPNDVFTVNEYSWEVSTQEFWVPVNCFAADDDSPVCSLKRELREGFRMPTVGEIGRGIISKSNFREFGEWCARGVNGINPTGLFKGPEVNEDMISSSYDPIWYLYHSMVEYHRSIWIDCNEYDKIDPLHLDEYPEAYTPFCLEEEAECKVDQEFPSIWKGMELDDIMYFNDDFKDKEWSYVHDNDLSVRQFYHNTRLGIVYDLGDGSGFFEDSGLKEYCKGKMNESWFIVNDAELYEKQQGFVNTHNMYMLVTFLVVIGCCICCAIIAVYRYCNYHSHSNKNKSLLLDDDKDTVNYSTFDKSVNNTNNAV